MPFASALHALPPAFASQRACRGFGVGSAAAPSPPALTVASSANATIGCCSLCWLACAPSWQAAQGARRARLRTRNVCSLDASPLLNGRRMGREVQEIIGQVPSSPPLSTSPVLAALQNWDPVIGLPGWLVVYWARTRASARRCTASRARRRRRGRAASGGGWCRGASTRRWGSSCETCTAAPRPPARWLGQRASSGGRGRASSAAACPSSGCRTPTSSTMARRPRTRAAEGLLAGPSRGRRCTPRESVGLTRGGARAAAELAAGL